MERVAVLIGTKGTVKKELERLGQSTVSVDSSDGTVRISSEDPVSLYLLKSVVLAVGRGFNPRIAEMLFKVDYVMDMIKLSHSKYNKKALVRVRSRVIGTKGKVRKYIESLTDVHVSIYGKTISIIGENRKVELAKRAIEMIINGSEHSNVYAWLESAMKNLRINQEYIKGI